MTNKAWEKVSFLNSRKLALAGLLYASSVKTGPVVVVCHGFTGGKEGGGKALVMGEELGALGFNVLLFDFSGNGESEGLFENLTLTYQIDDLNSAVNWCAAAGMGPVYTVGRSFGGTTVICHAAANPNVAGICTWSAPARLTELFSELAEAPLDDNDDRYALVGEAGIAYLRRGFFDDIKLYNVPLLAAKLAPRPLLVVHGEKDDVVSPSDAELIFNGAGEPKNLKFIPGADHQFSAHNREVWDIMFRWLVSLFPKDNN